jgi:hypothetical protein
MQAAAAIESRPEPALIADARRKPTGDVCYNFVIDCAEARREAVVPLAVMGSCAGGQPVLLGDREREEDLLLLARRRGEPCISHEKVKARLRRDGLLPH